MAYSVFSHLWLLFWPVNLTLYHEPYTASRPVIILMVCLLAALILLLPWIFRKSRPLFFSIGLFIVFLAPTYSPVLISWLIAERYLYIPSIAFSMWAAMILRPFGPQNDGRWRRPQNDGSKKIGAAHYFLIVIIVLFSVRTFVRNFDWKSHASIWRATVKVSPLSPMAHNNMGDVYGLEGNQAKAAEEFKRAIELRPDYAYAYHNLANTYGKMGRIDEAMEGYSTAIRFNPGLWQSYRALGVIYLNRGQVGPARKYFKKMLEINPADEEIKRVLGEMEKN